MPLLMTYQYRHHKLVIRAHYSGESHVFLSAPVLDVHESKKLLACAATVAFRIEPNLLQTRVFCVFPRV